MSQLSFEADTAAPTDLFILGLHPMLGHSNDPQRRKRSCINLNTANSDSPANKILWHRFDLDSDSRRREDLTESVCSLDSSVLKSEVGGVIDGTGRPMTVQRALRLPQSILVGAKKATAFVSHSAALRAARKR